MLYENDTISNAGIKLTEDFSFGGINNDEGALVGYRAMKLTAEKVALSGVSELRRSGAQSGDEGEYGEAHG